MNEFAKRRTWGPSPKYPLVEAYEPPSENFVVIAGPCSVESPEQIGAVANHVSQFGATHLRGGVFRAGTYPGNAFGLVGLDLLRAYSDVAAEKGLKNIIEVLDYNEDALHLLRCMSDCFQVGCRQMQNYTLLRMLGYFEKPVFLKRNPGATLDEWLGAAEHLLVGGVKEIYLVERGSVSHVNHVRWDLSISMIPAVKAITKIPVIVDASHGTGRRDLVEPMTLAGIAAGAGGLLCEVHPDPEKSLSDADQAIDFSSFEQLMKKVIGVRHAMSAV